MLVEFRAGERRIMRHTLTLLAKELEGARVQLLVVELPVNEVLRAEAAVQEAFKLVEKDETGEIDIEIPARLTYPMRLSLRIYRGALEKIIKNEVKQILETGQTEVRITLVNDLLARLGGQTTMRLETTVVS